MFFGSEDKNFILANTAPTPIQAQMPLICKGLRFPLCSIFNHLLTFLLRRLPLGKKDRRMPRRRSKSMSDMLVLHVRLNEKLWNARARRKKHRKSAAQQNGLLRKPSH